MMTATEKVCEACGMEYDWPGATGRQGEEFCCEACARGEPCICSQHEYMHQTNHHLSGEEAEQLGITFAES
jgi:hypothetical protein